MDYIRLVGDEIHQLAPLWHKLVDHHSDRNPYYKEKSKTASFERRIKPLLAAKDLLVLAAKDQERFLGYVMATQKQDHSLEIDSLFLDPLYRGKGIGQKLMEEAITWCQEKESGPISLRVAAGNEEVLPFYKQFGFTTSALILERPSEGSK